MLDAVGAMQVGAEAVERGREVGPPETTGRPAAQVVAQRLQVLGVVREAGREARDGRGHRIHVGGRRVARGVVGERAVGRLEQAQSVGVALELEPDRVGGDVGRRLEPAPGEGMGARPVDEVAPEVGVVEIADAVVAEEVGVRGDHDPARAVLADREQGSAGGRRGRRRARQHARCSAGRERAGAVEADVRDAGQEVGAEAAVAELCQDP